MINYCNSNRNHHIITIEDPVEFLHENKKCLVNHREVGIHTKSFASALRGALREDPDIILVGEMRDLETVELALTAAETGHLVFATLHTSSASETVDRIIDVFPTSQQNQIRSSLSKSLKGVIAQTLFKRVDKPGRLAILEILPVDMAVSNLIREGKCHQLNGLIELKKKIGAVSFDASIEEALKNGQISPEEAYDKANGDKYKTKFRSCLSHAPTDDFEE
jgi:twitching motility protein PilT